MEANVYIMEENSIKFLKIYINNIYLLNIFIINIT